MGTNKNGKVSWKGWLALAILVLMFSGVFRTSQGFLKAFDFLNLSGSFGTIADKVNFVGKGGTGAKEGFLTALTIIPSVCLAVGIINVVEEMGAMKAAEKLFNPILRPLLGISGACGVAFVSSFTSSDVAAIMTKELFDNGKLSDDERTIFVTYQYGASAVVLNTINTQAALLPIVVLGIGPIILVQFICKVLGANIVRVILAVKKRKGEKR